MTCTKDLLDGFSLPAKLGAVVSQCALLLVAVTVLLLEAPWMAGPYLLGVAVLLWGYSRRVCSRCPYLHDKDDCAFFLRRDSRLAPKRAKGPLAGPKRLFLLLWGGWVFGVPLIWLARHVELLVLFLATALAGSLFLVLRYCRRCRNVSCPMNVSGCSQEEAEF